jgi:hypothetical protein
MVVTFFSTYSLTKAVTLAWTVCVVCALCVLCVVVLFPVVEGPCKRYVKARHVCQATTASRGRRRSVSPEGDCMNKTKRFHGWIAVNGADITNQHWCCKVLCIGVSLFTAFCILYKGSYFAANSNTKNFTAAFLALRRPWDLFQFHPPSASILPMDS